MSYFPRIIGSWSIFLSLVMAICGLPRGKGWGKRKGKSQKAGPDHVFLILTNSKELKDFFFLFIIGFCPAVLQVTTVAWSATGSKLHIYNLFFFLNL